MVGKGHVGNILNNGVRINTNQFCKKSVSGVSEECALVCPVLTARSPYRRLEPVEGDDEEEKPKERVISRRDGGSSSGAGLLDGDGEGRGRRRARRGAVDDVDPQTLAVGAQRACSSTDRNTGRRRARVSRRLVWFAVKKLQYISQRDA